MAQNSIIEKLIDPQLSILKTAFERWGVNYTITSETDPQTKRKITKIQVSRYGKGGRQIEGTNIFKDGQKMTMNVKCSTRKSVKITVNGIPELLQKYSVLTGKEINDIDRFVQDIALVENKPEVEPDYSHFDNVSEIKKAIMQRTKKNYKTQIVDGELIYNINAYSKFGIYPLKHSKLRVDIYRWQPSKDGCGFTTIYDLSFIVSSEQIVPLFIDTMIKNEVIDKNTLIKTYADEEAGSIFDSHLKYDGEMPLSEKRKTLKTPKAPAKSSKRGRKKKVVEEPVVAVEEEAQPEPIQEETKIIKEELPEPEPEEESESELEVDEEDIEFENPNAGDIEVEVDEDDNNNSNDNDEEEFSDAGIF